MIVHCRYCERPAKTLNSNVQHEIRCNANPSRISVNLRTLESKNKGAKTLKHRLDAAYAINPNCCLQCNIMLDRKRKSNKFCSNSCAATYHNARRDYSVVRPGPKPKPTLPKEKLEYSKLYKCVCKHCGIEWRDRKRVQYCDKHKALYSHNGRAAYWFTFSLSKYPDLFDSTLIKQYGFRSATNPNGVTRDHKVSVNEAIKNNYDPYYIKHPLNCELMLFDENNRKNTKSSISYQELVQLVNAYEKS